MRNLFLVALGGAFGAVFRNLTERTVYHLAGEPQLFTAIFIENVAGCFLIGILFSIAKKHEWFTDAIRLFILVGFVGSYTTYSGFGAEAFMLFGSSVIAGFFYIFVQIVLGITAVIAGIAISNKLHVSK